MKSNESYILWLPSWYPNKLEPYNGDFIQRHAKAASLFDNIHVIHVVKDSVGQITKTIVRETIKKERLTETIIYYYVPPQKFSLLHRFQSLKKYLILYHQSIRQLIKANGKPRLIHLYIAFKAGLAALFAYYSYKIPYVISEQWTIYLDEAKPNYLNLPFYNRALMKKIFNRALSVMVVSEYLGKALQNHFPISKPVLIPNVVDENIFNYQKKELSNLCRFVHISNLNYQKNIEDIIKAFSMLKERGYNFRLDIIGPDQKELKSMVESLELKDQIYFHKEMPQKELAEYIQGSDALLLYSRYETFGCVVIEANACGVPVIASDIPVLHENIKEGINGIFAAGSNPADLADKIRYVMDNKGLFNAQGISENALQKYNYANAGLLFHNWYGQYAG